MSDDPGRVENQPYFKWRQDGSIQTTLGLAAGSVMLLCVGFDTISAFAHAGTDRRAHLALLALAAVLGVSIILQYRFVVLILREVCAAVIVGVLIGVFVNRVGLATAALAGAGVLGVWALVRMRDRHWERFRTYCKTPEVIPRAPIKQ